MITILQVLNTKLDLLVVNSEMHLSSAGFQKQNAQAEFASSLSPDSRKILGSGVRWGEGEQHDGVQRAFENGTTEIVFVCARFQTDIIRVVFCFYKR